jgi:hypothetical protein
MWKIPSPRQSVEDSTRACTSKMQNRGLARRVCESTQEIQTAVDALTSAATNAISYALDSEDFKLSSVADDEMEKMYTSHMASASGGGRHVYDSIKLLAPYGTCPMCGQRDVTTLDHHLPKKKFSALTIAPLNLIPMCGECNKVKNASIASSADDEYLYPYVGAEEVNVWISAEVVEGPPARVRFFVNPPISWSSTEASRYREHFKRFRLAGLYSSQASQEIASVAYSLSEALRSGGPEAVRQELLREYESKRRFRPNSWQAAMYAAISQSMWFCNGGFAEY